MNVLRYNGTKVSSQQLFSGERREEEMYSCCKNSEHIKVTVHEKIAVHPNTDKWKLVLSVSILYKYIKYNLALLERYLKVI